MTQLDSHTGQTYSADRFWATTGWERDLTGQRILEAGSGAGRFTEILAGTGARVYSFDLSDAVLANQANNGERGVNLFQADIGAIPFAARSFDRVVCMGVLQHTSDPRAAFASLAAMVRPGGRLAVDVYPSGLRARLHWKYLMRPTVNVG